jgi:hypothetical protein
MSQELKNNLNKIIKSTPNKIKVKKKTMKVNNIIGLEDEHKKKKRIGITLRNIKRRVTK